YLFCEKLLLKHVENYTLDHQIHEQIVPHVLCSQMARPVVDNRKREVLCPLQTTLKKHGQLYPIKNHRTKRETQHLPIVDVGVNRNEHNRLFQRCRWLKLSDKPF